LQVLRRLRLIQGSRCRLQRRWRCQSLPQCSWAKSKPRF
jgi:hypothetical protein